MLMQCFIVVCSPASNTVFFFRSPLLRHFACCTFCELSVLICSALRTSGCHVCNCDSTSHDFILF